LMVGRELKQFFHREFKNGKDSGSAPVVLEGRGLRWLPQQTSAADFLIRSGEIVGLAGLMGAGRTELAEALFRLRSFLPGAISLSGRKIAIGTPARAIAAGILLVPEDRRLQGLVLAATVRDNISLPSLDRLSWLRLVAFRKEEELARDMCQRLNVRTPST